MIAVKVGSIQILTFWRPKYDPMLGSNQVIKESGKDCMRGSIHGYCLIIAPLVLPATDAS